MSQVIEAEEEESPVRGQKQMVKRYREKICSIPSCQCVCHKAGELNTTMTNSAIVAPQYVIEGVTVTNDASNHTSEPMSSQNFKLNLEGKGYVINTNSLVSSNRN